MAAIVGDDWPEKISRAYLTFNASAEPDTDNAGVLLLRDIQEIYNHRNADKIPSAELVDLLVFLKTGHGLSMNGRSHAGHAEF